MTKKDYELFANEINGYLRRAENNPALAVPAEVFNTWVDITVTVFKKDNPAFKEDKYRSACYEGKHIRQAIKQS